VGILSWPPSRHVGAWASVVTVLPAMRSLRFVAFSLTCATFTVAGCAERPTADECQAFADKFVALVKEADDGVQGSDKLGTAMKTDIAKLCVQKGTKADIECVMNATTLDEVDAKCR
jgi:hypothetical protein